MPITFKKGTNSQPANALVLGAGINLAQTAEGFPEISSSSGGSGEAVIESSGGNDTAAIQSAMWTNARVRLAPGAFSVQAIIDVPVGVLVTGSGLDKTTVNKTNFNGPVFRFGDTTEYAGVENMRIIGPGVAAGTGNSGIAASRSGSGIPVARRLAFRNLHIAGMSDYGINLVSCAVVVLENIVLSDIGFNGIWCTGVGGRSIRLSNIRGLNASLYVRDASGVVFEACEVEGVGSSFKVRFSSAVSILGCSAIKSKSAALTLGGCNQAVVAGFVSDNRGTGTFYNSPHLLVNEASTGVEIHGFQKYDNDSPGTLTSEADVAAAGGRVLVGNHTFDTTKVLSSGKFAEVTAVALP